MLFVLAALALGAGCLMADEAWSEAITLDNASIGTIIQLLPEDEMAYSTKWVEGEDRSAQVTATDASGRFYQIFLTEQDGDETVIYANFHDLDPNSQKVEILCIGTVGNMAGTYRPPSGDRPCRIAWLAVTQLSPRVEKNDTSQSTSGFRIGICLHTKRRRG